MCPTRTSSSSMRVSSTQRPHEQQMVKSRLDHHGHNKEKLLGVNGRVKKSILRVKTLEESLNSCSSTIHSSTIERHHRTKAMDTSDYPSTPHNILAASSSSSSSSRKTLRKTVSFSEVMIREYAVTIGDNPSCSRGAPFTLQWLYHPEPIISSLAQYELIRKMHPPRTRSQMLIPMNVRHTKLKYEWNVSTSEMLRVIKEIKVIQHQRYKSATHQDRRIRAEALLETAKKSVRRLVKS